MILKMMLYSKIVPFSKAVLCYKKQCFVIFHAVASAIVDQVSCALCLFFCEIWSSSCETPEKKDGRYLPPPPPLPSPTSFFLFFWGVTFS